MSVLDETAPAEALGPVDWIVVEFPGSRFNGEIAPALADLVDRELVRVLDLVIVKKGADGVVQALEVSDLPDSEAGDLRDHERWLTMLLAHDDVDVLASAIEPGSAAAVLVWENRWALPFVHAVGDSGGRLVAGGRLPVQAILDALEEDLDDDLDELEGLDEELDELDGEVA